MAEITLRNLSHSYDGQELALNTLNHRWKQGGAYALLGPSGCGKSTLLNIISGLLVPSQGEVLFDGMEMNQLSPEQRNIAQVFQFPVVYDAMTVAQNLAFPLKNMGVEKKIIAAKVSEIAQILELTEILDNKARSLSADQKQKISMGRGLVRENVSAILFDEPLTVIDPHLKWTLRRKLKQIHQQFNLTMIYVTHDQLEAATFADEIALMYQGSIVQFGTPQDLFDQPNHTFVGYFIGSPGMNFVTCQRYNSQCQSQGISFPLSPAQSVALNTTESNNIKLGIRPEFVQVHSQPGPSRYAATVVDVEHLGGHQLLALSFLGQNWFVKVDERYQNDSEAVYIGLPAQHLKLYIDEYLAPRYSALVEGDDAQD